MSEISEDTRFNMSSRLFVSTIVLIFTIAGMWFTLKAEIAEAKKLPLPIKPDITRVEFELQDQLIRQTIETTHQDVQDIKRDMELIKKKLYE
jgi:hypothetical protein